MKWVHLAALYLLWPALALVGWGELSKGSAAIEALVWDKALHFSAYFGLSGMACLALKGDHRRVIAASFSLILLGGMLEILQGYTGRDPSLADELANTLGAITGAGTGWLIFRLLRPKALAIAPRS